MDFAFQATTAKSTLQPVQPPCAAAGCCASAFSCLRHSLHETSTSSCPLPFYLKLWVIWSSHVVCKSSGQLHVEVSSAGLGASLKDTGAFIWECSQAAATHLFAAAIPNEMQGMQQRDPSSVPVCTCQNIYQCE